MAESNSKTISVAIIVALFLVSLYLGYSLYETNEELTNCQSNFEISQADLDGSKIEIIDLNYKVKELRKDSIERQEDIEEYKKSIIEKQYMIDENIVQINQLNEELKEKTNEIAALLASGGTREQKDFINKLSQEINNLRSKTNELIRKNNELVKSNKILEDGLLAKERELSSNRNELEYLQEKVIVLEERNKNLSTLNEYANISAELSDLEVNSKDNSISFSINFSSNEVRLLKELELPRGKISIVPSIYNSTIDLNFYPIIYGELNNAFLININEISVKNNFSYVIENYNLSKAYKRKPLNFEKGDRIVLSVQIKELNNKEICNAVFYLK